MDIATRVASIMEGLLLLDGSLAPEVNFLRLHINARGQSGSSTASKSSLSSPPGKSVSSSATPSGCPSAVPASATTPSVLDEMPNPPGPPSGKQPSAFDFLMSRKRSTLPTTPAATPSKRTKTSAGFSYQARPKLSGGTQQQKGAAVRKLLEGAARAREVHKTTIANKDGHFALLIHLLPALTITVIIFHK
jgi:hypothetical protein